MKPQRESDAYERARLQPTEGREVVWRAITEHLCRWFPAPCETVVDLGCGYGDFINQVSASNRIGIDMRECDTHLADGVTFVKGAATEALTSMPAASVDLLMASNLLEHLEWGEVELLLEQITRVLRPGGRVMLLQPNFRYSARDYFDDYTHRTVFTDESLVGWVQAAGLTPVAVRPRYLPLTMKSRLPSSYVLTRLYLSLGSPILGAQMLVVAERR